MKNTVLRFGLLSGLVSAVLMFATVPFAETIGFDNSIYVGYTLILISMLFVYFGIRSYRDRVLGGQITFAKAFNAGILITVISCLCYVGSWLIMYYTLLPDFADKYGAHLVHGLQAKGASQAEVDAMVKRAADMKEMFKNPLINGALAFTEPFPVGLAVTLISAAVLRRRDPA